MSEEQKKKKEEGIEPPELDIPEEAPKFGGQKPIETEGEGGGSKTAGGGGAAAAPSGGASTSTGDDGGAGADVAADAGGE
jgi:hypothetical protein